jgi:glycosyltransferase involved in cell wall biosynthesis
MKHNMKHIALISEHASPLAAPGGTDSGGQNVYVAQAARGLARLGYRVDVFTRLDAPGLPDSVEWQPGIRVIHVPAGPPEAVPKEGLLGFMDAFTDFLEEFIRRQPWSYSLVHANFWTSGLVAADLKERLGLPFVITFHALGRVRRLHQGKADRFPDARFEIEDRIVREADHVIAECPQDEEDLLQLYGADPARITVIPCGFDPRELAPLDKAEARRELGLPADEFIVLQLGRMVPRKGVADTIAGFARLDSRHGPARLLVVGGESETPDPRLTPELGRLQRVARREGVEGQVHFLGRRDRNALRFIYSAADVFVTTPWYEPFGITPLEAMACATPVVGAAVGGIKYSVIDGETGFLIPPRDAAALGRRLTQLQRDPPLRRRMGRRAYSHVRSNFTWAGVSDRIAALYEEVLAPSARKEATHA